MRAEPGVLLPAQCAPVPAGHLGLYQDQGQDAVGHLLNASFGAAALCEKLQVPSIDMIVLTELSAARVLGDVGGLLGRRTEATASGFFRMLNNLVPARSCCKTLVVCDQSSAEIMEETGNVSAGELDENVPPGLAAVLPMDWQARTFCQLPQNIQVIWLERPDAEVVRQRPAPLVNRPPMPPMGATSSRCGCGGHLQSPLLGQRVENKEWFVKNAQLKEALMTHNSLKQMEANSVLREARAWADSVSLSKTATSTTSLLRKDCDLFYHSEHMLKPILGPSFHQSQEPTAGQPTGAVSPMGKLGKVIEPLSARNSRELRETSRITSRRSRVGERGARTGEQKLFGKLSHELSGERFLGTLCQARLELEGVVQIWSTAGAFLAELTSGKVLTWGDADCGGEVTTSVQEALEAEGIQRTWSAGGAFIVELKSGRVVAWGHSGYGSQIPSDAQAALQTRGLHDIWTTRAGAVLAQLNSGEVISWGWGDTGGLGGVKDRLEAAGVRRMWSTAGAFLAQLKTGEILCWTNKGYGGALPAATKEALDAHGIARAWSTTSAFLAELTNGSVVAWGVGSGGSGAAKIPDDLHSSLEREGVHEAFGTAGAFLVVLKSGRCVAWGDADRGADLSSVKDKLETVGLALSAPAAPAAEAPRAGSKGSRSARGPNIAERHAAPPVWYNCNRCSCLTALFLSRPECLDETQRLQLWSGVHLNELPEESMRSLVRAGVPSSLRWSLWTSHLRAAPRGSAQWPAEGTTPCAPPLEVAADAARTSLGGKRLVEEEVKSLEKVCAAYASRDPVIGYCQGMNFVVAVLLLASGGDEMETFQCFVGLVQISRSLRSVPRGEQDAQTLGFELRRIRSTRGAVCVVKREEKSYGVLRLRVGSLAWWGQFCMARGTARGPNRSRWLGLLSLTALAAWALRSASQPRRRGAWRTRLPPHPNQRSWAPRALAISAAAPTTEAATSKCQELQEEQLETVKSRIAGWEKASSEGRSVLRFGKQASQLLNKTLTSFDTAVRPDCRSRICC
eukprot:g6621.t1